MPSPPYRTGNTPEMTRQTSPLNWRQKLHRFLETPLIQRVIIITILFNALILGLETAPSVMERYGNLLYQLDRLCLGIFVVELSLGIVALGPGRFFRDPWRVFDFVVVGIALVPATGAFSVLRSLRVLRVLRLASASPRMRAVVSALLSAIPGLGSIGALLVILFYVAAVMTTKLFGPAFPEWFGSIGASMYTLFQIMTLESWSMGIVRPVLEEFPYAWLFFVPFIVTATFTMLNLFIAVIVDAMQSQAAAAQEQQKRDIELLAEEKEVVLHREMESLRREITELKEILKTQTGQPSATRNKTP
jgi:voltage-gated sodium channel